MPTATLTFTLPEEQSEHEHAIHGMDWALTVWDLDQWLRDRVKHGLDSAEAKAAWDAARDALREILDGRGLTMEMAGG